jgi:two-component system CheB/CheR fusion protein
LSRPAPPAARRTSVNTFLNSLAEDQGENAVAIILSGFGSDGALGIAAIKEHGGLTLSQAEFDHHAKRGMPQSAASAGFVDHVLTVEDMPKALLDYRHHRAICDCHKGPDGIRQDLPSHLATICAVLPSRLGRDFSDYKTGTLMRRIQRRMHVLQTDEVADYVEQLRSLPHEAEQLFRELLISVTRFFRDREAFEELEAKVIPGLLTNRDSADPVRVWVAGCATGEEAYSVAILLKEALLRADSRRPVQIFATDVDDQAIAVARSGLYLGSIASDLSPERLERHFVKEDGSYRIAKDIREMCLFSTRDLVKDPPFSRIDLLSCRNLLIYFEPALQQRVITTFHYALRPGHYLFLGPSESVASQAQLFAPLDKRHRLVVRRDMVAKYPVLSLSRHFNETPAKRTALDRRSPQRRRALARASRSRLPRLASRCRGVGHPATTGRAGQRRGAEPRPVGTHLKTTARDSLSKTQTVTVATIETAVPTLVQAREIVDAFHTLIRRKQETALDSWLDRAAASLLAPFARGLARDHLAVRAAIASA